MSNIFNSKSESEVAPYLLTLGIIACTSFAPHFQTEFTDKLGNVREHQPDFATSFNHANDKPLFIETKFSLLNSKTSFKSSFNAITRQHNHRHNYQAPSRSYAEMSHWLWNHNGGQWRNDILENSWNHAKSKILITQAAIGSENYLVVFPDHIVNSKKPENIKAFKEYDNRGLNYQPLSKLESYITTIARL